MTYFIGAVRRTLLLGGGVIVRQTGPLARREAAIADIVRHIEETIIRLEEGQRSSLIQYMRRRLADAEQLTIRQREIMALVARQVPYKQIAETLGITHGTVKVNITAIYRALGVSSRRQAVAAWLLMRQEEENRGRDDTAETSE